ncbi:hypothetical protein D3C71_1606000 [compost metagenome]
MVDHGLERPDFHAVAQRRADVDQEDRKTIAFLLHLVIGCGARQQQHQVGLQGARSPDLLAVDDVAVAVAHGAGLQARGVGAAGGLGNAESLQAQFAAGDGG